MIQQVIVTNHCIDNSYNIYLPSFLVSEKAAKAAKELREKLIKAHKKNEDILNSLQAMSESRY